MAVKYDQWLKKHSDIELRVSMLMIFYSDIEVNSDDDSDDNILLCFQCLWCQYSFVTWCHYTATYTYINMYIYICLYLICSIYIYIYLYVWHMYVYTQKYT